MADAEPVEGELVEDDESKDLVSQLTAPERRGRPTEMTAEVVRKLIAAFNNGFNITEACQYAGIPRRNYYDWLAKDDFFSHKMSEAQAAPTRKAKQVVVEALTQGDVNTAKWWLNAKDPEFSAKVQPPDPNQEKTEEKLKEFLDDTNDGAYDGSGEPTAAADSEG